LLKEVDPSESEWVDSQIARCSTSAFEVQGRQIWYAQNVLALNGDIHSARQSRVGCYGDRCNRSQPSHLEALIPAQSYSPVERCEPDCPGRRARNAEERMVRLGMQMHVVLQRAAVRTMIGEIALVVGLAADLPERAPGRELPGEDAVDGSDAADRELGERLAGHGAAFAVDADDLDA